jgi:predicted acetyltransferase
LTRYAEAGHLRDAVAGEQPEKIERDSSAFLLSLDDPDARGDPVVLPDGTTVPRSPGYNRWLSDGEFCGNIGFRWQNGTSELPPHCLGHIGFPVVPWKRRLGYATQALHQLLPEIREQKLAYVELTTDPDNIASQRVILANGGRLVERFTKAAAYGGKDSLRLRFRIDL